MRLTTCSLRNIPTLV